MAHDLDEVRMLARRIASSHPRSDWDAAARRLVEDDQLRAAVLAELSSHGQVSGVAGDTPVAGEADELPTQVVSAPKSPAPTPTAEDDDDEFATCVAQPPDSPSPTSTGASRDDVVPEGSEADSEFATVPPTGASRTTGNAGAGFDEGQTVAPGANDTVADRDSKARRLRIADYEVLEKIAQGGMGVVFKAKQDRLNRVVALKMIRSGQFAGDEEVKRFYIEAEAAAQLDHPSIVPVYEVGEFEGQHYFSMGFVDGESLADRIKNGPLPPRVAASLLVVITDAVQYAHEKGIVHRDLKPANILLDKDGKPKITDFGLAKTIGGGSQMTTTGQVLGTPSYMPPEQARGEVEEVGPRSDVYALGAILYACLTGRPPFQAASLMETLKQVIHQEPVSPRQLNADVDRDLETICLKALQKEQEKRYQSAEQLAEDLTRYLEGRPILARPVGTVARVWRWCRRNPYLASALTAATLFLIVALVASLVGFITTSSALQSSRQAQRESEASFRQALQVVNVFFTRVSEDTLLNQPGMQPLRRDLLELALDYYHRLLKQRSQDPTLQDELAATYFRIGVITDLLESPAEALPHFQKAETLQRRLWRERPADAQRQAALANTLNALGTTHFKLRRIPQALKFFQEAVRLREQLCAASPRNLEYRRVLANAHMNVGLVLGELGDIDGALEEFEKAQRVRQEALTVVPGDAKLQRDLAKGYYNIGSLYLQRNDVAEGAKSFERAVQQLEKVLAATPDDLENQKLLAICYRLLGDLAADENAARNWYDLAIQRLRPLMLANPGVTSYRAEMASLLLNLGDLEWNAGHSEKAVAHWEEARSILEPLVESEQSVPRYQRDLAVTLFVLADAAAEVNDIGRAKSLLLRARQLLVPLATGEPPDQDAAAQLEEVNALLKSLSQPEKSRQIP